jgi:hypothetical protein
LRAACGLIIRPQELRDQLAPLAKRWLPGYRTIARTTLLAVKFRSPWTAPYAFDSGGNGQITIRISAVRRQQTSTEIDSDQVVIA